PTSNLEARPCFRFSARLTPPSKLSNSPTTTPFFLMPTFKSTVRLSSSLPSNNFILSTLPFKFISSSQLALPVLTKLLAPPTSNALEICSTICKFRLRLSILTPILKSPLHPQKIPVPPYSYKRPPHC
ncbi:hypothetical protein C0989_009586, partial [Termitomyces sp. Mn162]